MMEEFKSSASRLAGLFKKSRDAWKKKALEKQRRLRSSQVKIRDLEQSRDRWKKRALEAKKALTGAGDAPEKEDETADSDVDVDVEKRIALSPPAGHHYSTMVMQLAIRMVLDASVGSRGVHRVLDLLGTYFPVPAPAYTTVLNWLYRGGLHVLKRPVERRTDWILVLDHTIALGQSKGLVVLGIPASQLERTGYSTGTCGSSPWRSPRRARVLGSRRSWNRSLDGSGPRCKSSPTTAAICAKASGCFNSMRPRPSTRTTSPCDTKSRK
jgi:hypothetical protein